MASFPHQLHPAAAAAPPVPAADLRLSAALAAAPPITAADLRLSAAPRRRARLSLRLSAAPPVPAADLQVQVHLHPAAAAARRLCVSTLCARGLGYVRDWRR